MKKYKFAFEFRGLILFLCIMLPTFIWFALPAPNDVLRAVSVTETVDIIGSVCQAVMIAALCLLKRTDCGKFVFSPLVIGIIVCCAAYYAGWIFYYNGFTNAAVILSLTIPPCAAFLLFALDRKNYIAVVPACGFTICHLIYGIINFII